MGTVELKSDIHKILDRIENEQLLRTIYDFLKQGENSQEAPEKFFEAARLALETRQKEQLAEDDGP